MLNIGSIVWGVRDMARATAFWTAALDYLPREKPDDDWVVLIPRQGSMHGGSGVQLALKLVSSPSAHRHHLDLYAEAGAVEVTRRGCWHWGQRGQTGATGQRLMTWYWRTRTATISV